MIESLHLRHYVCWSMARCIHGCASVDGVRVGFQHAAGMRASVLCCVCCIDKVSACCVTARTTRARALSLPDTQWQQLV